MKDMNKKTYLQPPTTISSKQSHLDRLAFLQKKHFFFFGACGGLLLFPKIYGAGGGLCFVFFGACAGLLFVFPKLIASDVTTFIVPFGPPCPKNVNLS